MYVGGIDITVKKRPYRSSSITIRGWASLRLSCVKETIECRYLSCNKLLTKGYKVRETRQNWGVVSPKY